MPATGRETEIRGAGPVALIAGVALILWFAMLWLIFGDML